MIYWNLQQSSHLLSATHGNSTNMQPLYQGLRNRDLYSSAACVRAYVCDKMCCERRRFFFASVQRAVGTGKFRPFGILQPSPMCYHQHYVGHWFNMAKGECLGILHIWEIMVSDKLTGRTTSEQDPKLPEWKKEGGGQHPPGYFASCSPSPH